MIQIAKNAAKNDVYVAVPDDLDGQSCLCSFINLSTNTKTNHTKTPQARGDWWGFGFTTEFASMATGMYLLKITAVQGGRFIAQRLVYIAPSSAAPITTAHDIYTSPRTHVVYNG